MSLSLDVKSIVYQKLSQSTALVNAVSGIFDGVPQGQAKPYVSLGEIVTTEFDDSCTVGDSSTITVHTISDKKGSDETLTIQGLIKDALHYTEATTSDSYTVGIMQEQSRSFLEPDGVTRHGVSTILILIKSQ